MKANGPKRKIFDAVDMMTMDALQAGTGNVLQNLPVGKIKPFHLYKGERLDDMVESIREHGVLNPVIVRKKGSGYEMLSGHNRQNAAKIAGLTEIPAIVKEGLSDEEAYVYVIETNVIQRSFTDLAPSEKAAVELSYLSEDEQTIVAKKDVAVNEKAAKALRAEAGELTEEKLEEILHPVKASAPAKAVSVKIPVEAEEKYFSGMKAKERTDLVMKALDAWFAGKEVTHV